jgi:hypothetical protein
MLNFAHSSVNKITEIAGFFGFLARNMLRIIAQFQHKLAISVPAEQADCVWSYCRNKWTLTPYRNSAQR